MDARTIKQLLEQKMPGAEVRVRGDDGVHFEAVVVSEAFEGKSLLQQHRMVYAVLGEQVSNQAIHALALKTYTPANRPDDLQG
ncbi:MAG: BolA/IbaG family iron-sulfur metabolism protein [Candidatus Competibacterales bacterium]|nr:BolA/IbaG family iron-sulfur metabolism protein [Candidatus Competibacterales bacterium]